MKELTRTNQDTLTTASPMSQLAPVADQVAAAHVFDEYRSRKAENTRRRQDAELTRFAEYLHSVGIETYGDQEPLTAAALVGDPQAWHGLSFGLVEGYQRWLLNQGFAVGTVNLHLSTVKAYAGLAAKAGTVDTAALALIKAVSGYSQKEAKRIDEQRESVYAPTRIGDKKPEALLISRDQADRLKHDYDDTPQERRDRLLMCLLIDHGLRVSEVAALTVGAFDLTRREFRFYRPKVDKTQTHELTGDSFAAAAAYLANDAGDLGPGAPLLRGSRKGGKLTGPGMSVQNINLRVKTLGALADIDGLSPHDLRHYWATTAARNGTAIDRLQDAGGWTSPAIPLTRYIEPAKIANEEVKLGN